MALERLGFGPDAAWPRGFYALALGFGVSLVVVNELPVEPATLLSRILGAGAVLHGALREIVTLPSGAPESELRPMVLRWWAALDAAAVRSPEEEEIYMTTRDLFDEMLDKGREEGLRSALARVLRARFGALDEATLARVHGATLTELNRWLDRAATVPSLAAVFAA